MWPVHAQCAKKKSRCVLLCIYVQNNALCILQYFFLTFMYNVAVHMSANLGAIILDNSSLITSATVQTLNLYMVFLYACSIIGQIQIFYYQIYCMQNLVSYHVISYRVISYCIVSMYHANTQYHIKSSLAGGYRPPLYTDCECVSHPVLNGYDDSRILIKQNIQLSGQA